MFEMGLAEFMDAENGFAEAVTIGGATGNAIFDAEYAEALSMSGTSPALTLIAADFPAIASGQSVTVRGDTYTIATIKPDGTGMAVVILEAD